MSFLFGRNRQKTPQELVRSLKQTILQLDSPLEKRRVWAAIPMAPPCHLRAQSADQLMAVVQASEEATKILYQLKLVLQGNTGPPSLDVPRPEHPEINVCNPTETEPLPEQVQALSDEVINKDLLPILADNLFRLDFEVLSYFIF